MSSNGDGREEYLAPVTDLFSRKLAASSVRPDANRAPTAPADTDTDTDTHAESFDADGWWVDPAAETESEGETESEAEDTLEAPLPFPGLMRASQLTDGARKDLPAPQTKQSDEPPAPHATGGPRSAGESRSSNAPRERRPVSLRPVSFVEEPEEAPAPTDIELADAGERALLKRLAGRGMSVAESRTFLRGKDVPQEHIERILDDFLSRGYLNDGVLAEQLVYSALTRKKQGRRAVAQTLSARGIDRETVDAALAELPDDDAERALEFARSKAHSMAKLDGEVALRRLVGQLARRGFGGGVAMTAAKTALAEVSGVRFR